MYRNFSVIGQLMATETAFRPHVDQENAQAVNIKGGAISGKNNGPNELR